MKKEEITLTNSQLKKFNALKLTIELIPSSSWASNIRKLLGRTKWDKLKAIINQKADYKCEICGGVGIKHPVECHEIWEFDEDTRTQKLVRFISLCPLCHQVKHIGLSKILGNFDRAYKRFRKINELTKKETELFYSYYWQIYHKRSKVKWTIDSTLLENYNLETKRIFVHGPLNTSYKIDKDDFKCPFCSEKDFIRCGTNRNGYFRYKCNMCKKSFISEISTSKKEEFFKNAIGLLKDF